MLMLLRLRVKKACGPDRITATILKKCAPSIADTLAEVFNTSLAEGRLPSEWKESHVVPVFKSGDPAVVGNYRPISLLSLVSKALERIVHNTLISRYREWHGFGRPVWLQAWEFNPGGRLGSHHASLEKQQSVGCVFDLSKAFDSLPHKLVLESLSCCRVSGPLMEWFKHYLFGRWQRVVLDGVTSGRVRVQFGVPQGSILGLLLFIITMDSLLRQSFSLGTSISMYTDDIALYKALTCDEDRVAFQSDVTMVKLWAEDKELRLNTTKRRPLLFQGSSPQSYPLWCED